MVEDSEAKILFRHVGSSQKVKLLATTYLIYPFDIQIYL